MTDDSRVLDAIEVVREHLRKEWIEPGCAGERVAGCISCFMSRLNDDLEALVYEIESNQIAEPVPA